MSEIYEFKFGIGEVVAIENIPNQKCPIRQCVIECDGSVKYAIDYNDTAGFLHRGLFPEAVLTAAQEDEIQSAPNQIEAAGEEAAVPTDAEVNVGSQESTESTPTDSESQESNPKAEEEASGTSGEEKASEETAAA